MRTTMWLLSYSADTEGEWFCQHDPYGLYPTREAAVRAWEREYLGPDDFGAEARPEIVEMTVDEIGPDGAWAYGPPPREWTRFYPVHPKA